MTALDDTTVLHVVTQSRWGGAQRIVKLLCSETTPRTAVACAPGGRLIRELGEIDVPVHTQSRLQNAPSAAGDPYALIQLYRTIESVNPDFVHCHSTKAGMLGRVAAAMTSLPAIFTVHGWGFYNTEYEYVRPGLILAERALSPVTTGHVCVSQHDLQVGRDRGILSESEGRVIRNGIPTPSVEPTERIRSELSLNEDTVIIGAIARLTEQKAPERILETGKRLRANGHDVATVLVGDGPLKEICERLATGITDSYVLGFREDALECLSAFDIFLLPSRFEGLPLTILEAMHLGVPVVAYDVGGVSEAVINGETGRVVHPDQDDQFYRATETLVENPKLRQQFGEQASVLAGNQFTAERMASEYDEVYGEILDNFSKAK